MTERHLKAASSPDPQSVWETLVTYFADPGALLWCGLPAAPVDLAAPPQAVAANAPGMTLGSSKVGGFLRD
jgi:hypothetical protein